MAEENYEDESDEEEDSDEELEEDSDEGEEDEEDEEFDDEDSNEKSFENKNKDSNKNMGNYFIIGLVAIFVIVIGIYFFNGINGNAVSEEIVNDQVSADDDAVEGILEAPVTIIEFSDYECPFCIRFYSETLPKIRSEYVETGKVKIIYRDFPLSSIHPQAQKAGEAAECAGEQDKYYEMHDKLFGEGVSGGVESFKEYAKEIGLDIEEFNLCLDSGKMAGEVAKDLKDGTSYGIDGTPSFFVNGRLVNGAQPFSEFQKIIEEELNKNAQ